MSSTRSPLVATDKAAVPAGTNYGAAASPANGGDRRAAAAAGDDALSTTSSHALPAWLLGDVAGEAADRAVARRAVAIAVNATLGVALAVWLLEVGWDPHTFEYSYDNNAEDVRLRWCIFTSTVVLILQIIEYHIATSPTTTASGAGSVLGGVSLLGLWSLLLEIALCAIHPFPAEFGDLRHDEKLALVMVLRVYTVVRVITHYSPIYRKRRTISALAVARAEAANRARAAAVASAARRDLDDGGDDDDGSIASGAAGGSASRTRRVGDASSVPDTSDGPTGRAANGAFGMTTNLLPSPTHMVREASAARTWEAVVDTKGGRIPTFGHAMALRCAFDTHPWRVLAAVWLYLFLAEGWAVYIQERGAQPEKFDFETSCWFVIETMTTVGYGEFYPVQPLGRLVASFCVVSGVMVISMGVVVLVNQADFSSAEAESLHMLRKVQAVSTAASRAAGPGDASSDEVGWMEGRSDAMRSVEARLARLERAQIEVLRAVGARAPPDMGVAL